MRRIINSTFISLDGAVENPHLWPQLEGPGGGDLQTDLLLSCDAVLMGRRTYEGFAAVWPDRAGSTYADHLNAMRKYVASTTLTDPRWHNTTVISGDIAGEIAWLKEQPGRDIVQYGFGPVTYTMLAHGLLDEVRFWLHPLFIGSGTGDLLARATTPTRLTLAGVTTLGNGIVVLAYRIP
jgi:dihydrofolate reductase